VVGDFNLTNPDTDSRDGVQSSATDDLLFVDGHEADNARLTITQM
jgi:hypothetical protein